LSVTLSDGASNTGKMNWSNHVLNQTVAGKVGDTVNSTIQIFDVQGTAHNLSVTFQKQAANTWNLTASIPAADGTMVNSTITGITFNDDGSFRQINGANQNISFTVKGLSAAQTVKFSFGSANGFNGLTQFGSASSAAATSQDGFAAGFLTNISISQSGLVNGVFTNGRTLAIAQLAIANFSNAQGLNREGNNYYSLSSHSGDPLIGEGVSGGRGNVKQGSLESSNVDVALEFTQLITAQRGYQVNARTITISDQILQSLAQIIQ
jgi:flagellar hook protein FlgE